MCIMELGCIVMEWDSVHHIDGVILFRDGFVLN